MFDDRKYMESDDLMRSILSEAQEEVPAHLWDSISSELDRIEAAKVRKPVVLWFRRSAVAVAAAAAVAVGVFVDWNGETVPVTSAEGMIAVVEPQVSEEAPAEMPAEEKEETVARTAEKIRNVILLADAAEEVEQAKVILEETSKPSETVIELKETGKVEDTPAETDVPADDAKYQSETPGKDYFPEDWSEEWPEEEVQKKNKARTSIVLSGIAGTNSAQSNGGSPLRLPQLSQARPQTGVVQKSTESTYGLPLSMGAGVKIDFNDRWAVGIGANYTLLTRKFYGTYTLVNSEGSVEKSITSDIRNAQQYIGIPVNAYFNIVNKDYVNFYAYAGGTVEKCFSDKYDVLNTEFLHKNKVKGVQLSANIGLGVEFMLGRHLGLYMDPSLRYYFDCDQPKSIRTVQPLMLGFEMGLRVRL